MPGGWYLHIRELIPGCNSGIQVTLSEAAFSSVVLKRWKDFIKDFSASISLPLEKLLEIWGIFLSHKAELLFVLDFQTINK